MIVGGEGVTVRGSTAAGGGVALSSSTPSSEKNKRTTAKTAGGDDYHCTPLLQEDSASPRLVQKRLRSLLGREFKALTDLTIRLWNEPSLEDHHAAIIDLVNAGEPTKLAGYLTNLTKFTQHRARLEVVRSKIRSPNPQVRASVQRTIDRLKDSNDTERRAFGARLEQAVHALDTLSEPANQPRPLNLTGRGYGFDVWEVPFRIAAESRMVALFQDERFQEVWQGEYKKTDDYKVVERRLTPFRRVRDADSIVTDLKGKDPKVRAKAYGALVTKIKLAGGKATDEGVVALSQATVLLTHDRTLHVADRNALKALYETPPKEPMISVRTVDDDASDDDRRIQGAEGQEESARMQRNQDAYADWTARHDRGMAIVGGLYAKFEKRLDAAKPESKMVKRIAASERKSERRALVKDMRLKAKDMSEYNAKDADRVVKLAGQIEAETDYKKLMALHERGSFIAQTGFMLAQIRGMRAVQKNIEKQMKRDAKTAYWAARASTLFIWRPAMANADSSLGVTLDAAERYVLKARKMHDTGAIKDKPKRFEFYMKQVQRQFGQISKAIKEDQNFLNSEESDFMRTSVAFGIIATAVLASAVTGGAAGALFGESALAATGALLISSFTFTSVQVAGNHYVMGQDVTRASFGEDLFWNTVMFGGFGKLGKWLKLRFGIKAAEQGAKTSRELLARIPARYGMEGMKLTGVNILKLSGKAFAKELGVLTVEAAAFQVFEAGKLTVRATGLSAHPVDSYVKELRNLFTAKSAAHGLANLAAIKGVGYGSSRVTQLMRPGLMRIQVKRIRTDVNKMIGVLKQNRQARAKGRKTMSPQAEAELAIRLFQQVATLSALSGKKPGSFVKSAFALARDAAVRAENAPVGDVARSLGARDVKGFEAAVQRLPEGERGVVVQKLVELDAALKIDGKIPSVTTRVKMFLLRGLLKRMGFGLNGYGRLVPYEVAVRKRAAAGQRGMVDLGGGKGKTSNPAETSGIPEGKVLSAAEFSRDLKVYNDMLAEFDAISAKQRSGEILSEQEQAVTQNPRLQELAGKRASFVSDNYVHHEAVSAAAKGSLLRQHLDTHLTQVDVGSGLDVKVFGGAEAFIKFSEGLLTKAYRGEVKPGAGFDITVQAPDGKPMTGKVKVMKTGDKADGVDVGPSGTGGRVVIQVTFDRSIGEEGITRLRDGQNGLTIDRTSGGREETVQVVDGTKPKTKVIYIVGGSFGPTGRFGLYTAFSGRYSPPMTDTAYWGKHAFLTGNNRSSWKKGPDGNIIVRAGSNLASMIADGKAKIDGAKVVSAKEFNASQQRSVKLDADFGTRVQNAVSSFFRSALAYFHGRAGNGAKDVADKLVDSGTAVFLGEKTQASRNAVDLVKKHASDPAALAQLQMKIFDSKNAGSILRVLYRTKTAEGQRLIVVLIPELKGREIAQDAKYHKGESVIEHLVKSVKVAEGLIREMPEACQTRYGKILRMVALFHDIGKHNNPNGPKEGRRTVEDGKTRFLGHESYSARMFEEIVRSRINPRLPKGQRLSDTDIAIARQLIAKHMDAIALLNSAKSSGKMSPKALRKFVERLALYNRELIQRGVSIDHIVELMLAVSKMDVMSSARHEGKSRDLVTVDSVAKQVRAQLPKIKRAILDEATEPLVNGGDVAALGIKGPAVGKILKAIKAKQVDGSIYSRSEALAELARTAGAEHGVEIPSNFTADRLKVPLKSKRVLRQQIAHEIEVKGENGEKVATIRFYRSDATPQFVEGLRLETLGRHVNSGSYKHLQKAVERGDVTLKQVYELLTKRGLRNLRTIDEMVRKGDNLAEIGHAGTVPTIPVIEVVRVDGTKIVIEGGYQGKIEHIGKGGFHVGAQRLAEIAKFFRKTDGAGKPADTMEGMFSRFLQDVVKVLASSKVEIPSHMDPNAAIILGEINGGSQYVGVIVDKSNPKQWKVLTSVFQSSAKGMRKKMAHYYLRKLRLELDGGKKLSDAQFQAVMDGVNGFLRAHGQKPLSLDALHGLDNPSAPGTGEGTIKQAIKAKGYKGKAANKIFSDVQQKCETFAEAMRYVRDQVKDAPKPKAKKAQPHVKPYIGLLKAKGYEGKALGPQIGKIKGMLGKGKTDADIQAYIKALPNAGKASSPGSRVNELGSLVALSVFAPELVGRIAELSPELAALVMIGGTLLGALGVTVVGGRKMIPFEREVTIVEPRKGKSSADPALGQPQKQSADKVAVRGRGAEDPYLDAYKEFKRDVDLYCQGKLKTRPQADRITPVDRRWHADSKGNAQAGWRANVARMHKRMTRFERKQYLAKGRQFLSRTDPHASSPESSYWIRKDPNVKLMRRRVEQKLVKRFEGEVTKYEQKVKQGKWASMPEPHALVARQKAVRRIISTRLDRIEAPLPPVTPMGKSPQAVSSKPPLATAKLASGKTLEVVHNHDSVAPQQLIYIRSGKSKTYVGGIIYHTHGKVLAVDVWYAGSKVKFEQLRPMVEKMVLKDVPKPKDGTIVLKMHFIRAKPTVPRGSVNGKTANTASSTIVTPAGRAPRRHLDPQPIVERYIFMAATGTIAKVGVHTNRKVMVAPQTTVSLIADPANGHLGHLRHGGQTYKLAGVACKQIGRRTLTVAEIEGKFSAADRQTIQKMLEKKDIWPRFKDPSTGETHVGTTGGQETPTLPPAVPLR